MLLSAEHDRSTIALSNSRHRDSKDSRANIVLSSVMKINTFYRRAHNIFYERCYVWLKNKSLCAPELKFYVSHFNSCTKFPMFGSITGLS